MATVTTLSEARPRSAVAGAARERRAVFVLLAASLLAFALLGYHPYAEDGGIYSSALSLRLHPSLFPAYREFAVAHTGKSLFIPAVAVMVRESHLPQEWVVLALYLASITATVYAAYRLTGVFFPAAETRLRSVLLLAVAMGLPVAGTSLYLADPYLTARSFSTPLVLMALAALLQRRKTETAIWFAAAFAIHPLMTIWALLPAAFLLIRWRSPHPLRTGFSLGAMTVAGMAAVQILYPANSVAVRAASLSRNYWFLSQWQWYEVVGLVAPCLLLAVFALVPWNVNQFRTEARQVAAAMVAAMATVTAGSLLLIHTGNAGFLLARTQPLRMLHPVTMVFVLLLGGWIAEMAPVRRPRGMLLLLLLAATGGMYLLQRSTYRNSGHWELPGKSSGNGYGKAALWLRDHTPEDAVLATDAHYTTAPGEDAQMVRAIALRSTVPDAAKDGGIASVMPGLAEVWMRQSEAQKNLADLPDAARLQQLQATGATWVLLPAKAATSLPCPYRNQDAELCRLP